MSLPRTAVTAFRFTLIATLMVVTHLATTPLLYPVLADINDKVGHSSAFFALAFLADFSFPRIGLGLSKVLALLAYGLCIEIVQYFLPYRTFSMLDLAADGVGIAVYYLSLPALRHVPLLRQRWKTGHED